MSTSENGWPASEDRNAIGVGPLEVNGIPFPGGVRSGDVEQVLGYVAREFHERVEPLDTEGCWGYNYRPISGSSSMSNHSSGTACDFNAPKHPQGKRGTFAADQEKAIRAILDECGGVVRWGGDWDNVDEMHFEIYADKDEVARVAGELKSGGTGARPLLKRGSKGDAVKRVQKAVGAKVDGIFGTETERAVKDFQRKRGLAVDGVVGTRTWGAIASPGGPGGMARPTLQRDAHGEHVVYLQRLLNKMFPAYSDLEEDGRYGKATIGVVKEFQERSGLKVDGVVGPKTWAKLLGG